MMRKLRKLFGQAPGYDRYTLKLIREMWPVIGKEIIEFVIEFFKIGKFHPTINMVTLIPKVTNR